MAYRRDEIEAGAFAGLLPDGAKLYRRPQMPVVEFKHGGIKYSVTDFRLLHPYGVQAFEMCLNEMIKTPDAKECRIETTTEVDEDTVQKISDILLGFGFTAKKGGKKGFEIGSCVIGSISTTREGDKTVIIAHFADDFAKHVYEYGRLHPGEEITLSELVIYSVEEKHKDLEEWLEKEWSKGDAEK